MLLFEIPGKPLVQKQTQFTKKGWAFDPSKKGLQFLKQLFAAKIISDPSCQHLDLPFTGQVELHMWFYFVPPKSTPREKREHMLQNYLHPIVRPDFDNMAYIVTNAMKGIVYGDDSYITEAHIYKRYREYPGTLIKVGLL